MSFRVIYNRSKGCQKNLIPHLAIVKVIIIFLALFCGKEMIIFPLWSMEKADYLEACIFEINYVNPIFSFQRLTIHDAHSLVISCRKKNEYVKLILLMKRLPVE